jgi:hypothetical protein
MGDIVDQMIDKTNKFCKILLSLVDILYAKDPSNKEVMTMKNLAEKGAKHQPDYLITKIGPYLFQYQKQIIDGDVEFFENIDYDKKYGSKKNYNKKGVQAVRSLSKKFTPKEREICVKHIQKALKCYLEYVMLEKSKTQ